MSRDFLPVLELYGNGLDWGRNKINLLVFHLIVFPWGRARLVTPGRHNVQDMRWNSRTTPTSTTYKYWCKYWNKYWFCIQIQGDPMHIAQDMRWSSRRGTPSLSIGLQLFSQRGFWSRQYWKVFRAIWSEKPETLVKTQVCQLVHTWGANEENGIFTRLFRRQDPKFSIWQKRNFCLQTFDGIYAQNVIWRGKI